MIGNTSKNISSSLVSALDYALILFFPEKDQVPPSKHVRTSASKREATESKKSTINST